MFNIGTRCGIPIQLDPREIGAVAGRPLEVQYAAARGFDVPVNILDAGAARGELGWRASTPLSEGLRRTYEWMRRK